MWCSRSRSRRLRKSARWLTCHNQERFILESCQDVSHFQCKHWRRRAKWPTGMVSIRDGFSIVRQWSNVRQLPTCSQEDHEKASKSNSQYKSRTDQDTPTRTQLRNLWLELANSLGWTWQDRHQHHGSRLARHQEWKIRTHWQTVLEDRTVRYDPSWLRFPQLQRPDAWRPWRGTWRWFRDLATRIGLNWWSLNAVSIWFE